MAKPFTPPTPPTQPPAPAPEAPVAPEAISTPVAPVAPEVPAAPEPTAAPEPEEASTTSDQPIPPPSSDLKPYRVNWHFLGFLGREFQEGDTVDATEEDAAPYVGGVLTLLP